MQVVLTCVHFSPFLAAEHGQCNGLTYSLTFVVRGNQPGRLTIEKNGNLDDVSSHVAMVLETAVDVWSCGELWSKKNYMHHNLFSTCQ